MAVFGAPLALEHHAVRACLSALGIQEEAKRLAVAFIAATVWSCCAGGRNWSVIAGEIVRVHSLHRRW